MTVTPEQFASLRLIRSHGIGPQTFWCLLKGFGSAKAIIDNWSHIQTTLKRKVDLSSEKSILLEVEKTLKSGAAFLFYTDISYPERLLRARDKPPVLTIKGQRSLLSENQVALVGARNASSHGCRLTYVMAKELGSYGWKTVSGLARGIDRAAHQGSLESGTIAVLGNGISTIYPEENSQLHNEIAEKGLLISEFPFDADPHTAHFPKRNKLIASLAQGIVVIEAAYQSGSLLTAQYGLEMGRDIFAVPGSPMDPRCRGSNGLIKQGAILTESVHDILEILDQSKWLSHRKKFLEKPKKLKLEGNIEDSSILEHLSVVPLSVDELVELTHLSMQELSASLIDLELNGKIIKHPGNKISLTLPA